MSSNAANALARQKGHLSTLVNDNNHANSKYFYRGYHTSVPKHMEHKTILSDSRDITLSVGNYNDFTIPLHSDKLGPLSLCWDQAALTTTGGTYRRFQDYFPLTLIEKAEFRSNNAVVYTWRPEKTFWKIHKHLSQVDKDVRAAEMAGNLTTAERNTLAAASQKIIVDLDFPFTLAPDRYQEIRPLAVPPCVRVYWRSLNNIVQTDGTVPVSAISNLELRTTQFHFEVEEKDTHVHIHESDHGIVRIMEETMVDETTASTMIPTGTSGVFQLELKNWKTDVRFAGFWLRPRLNLVANLAVNLTWETDQFIEIDRFRLVTGSGEEIIPWTDGKFNLFRMHNRWYYGPAGTLAAYFYSWSDNPQDELNCEGSYNFQALQNPILEIDVGSTPTAADIYVMTLRSVYNLSQNVRGDVSRQLQY